MVVTLNGRARSRRGYEGLLKLCYHSGVYPGAGHTNVFSLSKFIKMYSYVQIFVLMLSFNNNFLKNEK